MRLLWSLYKVYAPMPSLPEVRSYLPPAAEVLLSTAAAIQVTSVQAVCWGIVNSKIGGPHLDPNIGL